MYCSENIAVQYRNHQGSSSVPGAILCRHFNIAYDMCILLNQTNKSSVDEKRASAKIGVQAQGNGPGTSVRFPKETKMGPKVFFECLYTSTSIGTEFSTLNCQNRISSFKLHHASL